MTKTIEVQTEELGAVLVRKLALKEYAELLNIFGALWPKIREYAGENAGDMKNEDFIALIPEIMEKAFPELMDLVSRFTDKKPDEIAEIDLGELLDIVATALELNNFQHIVSSIKKIMALRRASAPKSPVAKESPQTNG